MARAWLATVCCVSWQILEFSFFRVCTQNSVPTILRFSGDRVGLAGAATVHASMFHWVPVVVHLHVIASIVTGIDEERSNAGSLLGPSVQDPGQSPAVGPLTALACPPNLPLSQAFQHPSARPYPGFSKLPSPPNLTRGCCLRTCNKTTSPLNSRPISPLYSIAAPLLLLPPCG